MSKRQSANGTQSPIRGTPPLQTVNIYINNSYEKTYANYLSTN
jgi:hypothetical protein